MNLQAGFAGFFLLSGREILQPCGQPRWDLSDTCNMCHVWYMGIFDKPARVRMHVYIEAGQRSTLQRIAGREGTTAAAVLRAALHYGLPALERALLQEAQRGVPAFRYPTTDGKPGPIAAGRPLLDDYVDAPGEALEVEQEEVTP